MSWGNIYSYIIKISIYHSSFNDSMFNMIMKKVKCTLIKFIILVLKSDAKCAINSSHILHNLTHIYIIITINYTA